MTWKKRDKGGDVLRRASLLWQASLSWRASLIWRASPGFSKIVTFAGIFGAAFSVKRILKPFTGLFRAEIRAEQR